jgi:hypothetical protein
MVRRFVTVYIRISELRRVEVNGSKKLWYDALSHGCSGEGSGNQFDIVNLSQLVSET